MAVDGSISPKKKLLILQNKVFNYSKAYFPRFLHLNFKGGGHGSVGYNLCLQKKVVESMEVVILQDKCNYKKTPFAFYKSDLEVILFLAF